MPDDDDPVVEPVVEPPAAPQPKPHLHRVRVALPNGTVHDFDLPSDAPLSTVTENVLNAESLDRDTVRVRLIIAGRLHHDITQPIASVVPPGGYVHCALSDVPPAETPAPSTSANPSAPASRLPEVRISLEAYDGQVRVLIPNLNSTAAYDRLRQAGFSPEEIRFIRRHIRALRRESRSRRDRPQLPDPDQPSATTDSHDQDDPQRGTDITIRTRGFNNNGVFAAAAEGTNSDFLMGCIFGYLLGIIVLVLLLDNNATRRWRVGIIAGVATNCAFGILRLSLSFGNIPYILT